MKHSKSPWRIETVGSISEGSRFVYVKDADGQDICVVSGRLDWDRHDSLEATEFNAKLIAMAPEMYKALVEARFNMARIDEVLKIIQSR